MTKRMKIEIEKVYDWLCEKSDECSENGDHRSADAYTAEMSGMAKFAALCGYKFGQYTDGNGKRIHVLEKRSLGAVDSTLYIPQTDGNAKGVAA